MRCAFLLSLATALLHRACGAHEQAQNSSGPATCGRHPVSQPAQGKHATPGTEPAGVLPASRGHVIHPHHNFLQMQKEGTRVLRNTNDQERTLLLPFFLRSLPCIGQSLNLEAMT